MIDLHVPDNPLTIDMILGRDFLDKHNLSATYIPGKSVDENAGREKIELFPTELPTNCLVLRIGNRFEDIINEISIDFDLSIKSKLNIYC